MTRSGLRELSRDRDDQRVRRCELDPIGDIADIAIGELSADDQLLLRAVADEIKLRRLDDESGRNFEISRLHVPRQQGEATGTAKNPRANRNHVTSFQRKARGVSEFLK